MFTKKGLWFVAGACALVLLMLLVTPRAASANVRLDNGGQVPFYARLAEGEYYTDGTWVAVVFYRPPTCIPPGFNLLAFFDFVNAWDCQPATTDGFDVWRNGPGVDMAPILSHLNGNGAVPVWFVRLSELQGAVSDGLLTTGELGSLPSLRLGSASFYRETLHPLEGAVRNHLNYEAHGVLQDGTPFKVHAVHTESVYNVRIDFGS